MKYIKLGPKASNFHDVTTGIKVLPGKVVAISEAQYNFDRVANAIQHQHLLEATEAEYDAYRKKVTVRAEQKAEETKTEQAQLSTAKKMTKKDWVEKIKSEFEIEEDELARLETMKLSELEAYYAELTSDEDTEDEVEDN